MFDIVEIESLKEDDVLVHFAYYRPYVVTDPKTGNPTIAYINLGSYYYLNNNINLLPERMKAVDSSSNENIRLEFYISKVNNNNKIININNFSTKAKIINETDSTVILNNRIIEPNFEGKITDAPYNITSINAEIESPVAGNLPSKTVTFTNNLNADAVSEYEVIWRKFIGGASDSREMPRNWTDMQEDEKFAYDSEYMVLIEATLKNEYGFGPGFTKTVNSNDSMMATADNGFAYQFAKLPTDYSYTFLDGDNQKLTMGKIAEYEFRLDGDFAKFTSLEITGLTLEKDTDYTVEEGSTIIKFTEEGLKKLNTLNAGEYSIKVNYVNQKVVEGKLIIEEDKTPVIPVANDNENQTTNDFDFENPKTFDGGMFKYIIFAVVAIAGIIGVTIVYKKINKSNLK